MASPASVKRHPIHPMLVPFPIALWVFSLIADVIYQMGWGSSVWISVAYFCMVGGLVGALAAAVPGVIDFRSIEDLRVKRIARNHMLLNLAVVALFAVNIWMRSSGEAPPRAAILLSIAGIFLLSVSGWLGGSMVYEHGVAVQPYLAATKKGDNRAA
jgi:uncharacterized membrane protein